VDDVMVTNGDTGSARAQLTRDDALAELGEAIKRWGADVPEDPGAGELAELLNELADQLRNDQRDERLRSAAGPLAEAAAALGAVSRLGGLLPAVTLWHLRTAVEKEKQARRHLTEAAAPQSGGKTLSATVGLTATT
jgi:hypothetical protein